MLKKLHGELQAAADQRSTGMAVGLLRPSAWASWLRSVRLAKTLPIGLLLVTGALTSFESVPVVGFAVAALAVLAASVFMTHLNIVTDVELDRHAKPELHAALASGPLPLGALLVAEGQIVVASLLLVLSLSGWIAAAALAIFALCGVFYSYNLLAPAWPVRMRLKAHWWGHILAVPPGYAALWVAGYVVAGGTELDRVWPAFGMLALSEYALFMLESGGDAGDESARKMRTLGALIGAELTNMLACLVAGASLVGLIALLRAQPLLLLCLAPSCLARAGYLLWAAAGGKGHERRGSLVDAVFLGARVLSLIALGFAHVAQGDFHV